ncbi:MAG: hypothetical protein U5J97_12365 [Trueperaceae bacterium]|nr:hypothetical protein [Trueperaceae bacterium]
MQTNHRHRSLSGCWEPRCFWSWRPAGTQTTPTTTFDLSVTAVDGDVVSDPAGIDTAAGDTSFAFDEGTEVTLTASADAGFVFDGWSGDCDATTGNECTVTMDAAKSVTATFVVETDPTTPST